MQNQHVTPFSSRGEAYPGVSQENPGESYAIDPSLEDSWTPQEPPTHQYLQARYATSPQYYLPYNNQPAQQQPVFQSYSNSIPQAGPYAYQPQVNQYSDPLFSGPSSQHGFANSYGFSSQQPSQQETISPQALQVEDHIGNDVIPQNAFNQRALGQQQASWPRSAQHERWARDQIINQDAHFFNPLNGHADSKTNTGLDSQQHRGATLEHSSYMNAAAGRASTIPNSGFDSGFGQSPSVPPASLSVQESRPDPLRVTNQTLLNQYPSEKDTTHRVPKLPFVVLGETVTQLDIRGKTTIPKYHARGNSLGKNFAPRTDLFATRSAAPTLKRGPGRPRLNKQASAKSKAVSKAALLKDAKARLVGTNIIKQGSPATPSLASSSDSSSEESEEEESEEEEEMNILSWNDVHPGPKPTNDPAAAAKHDALKIVFKEGPQHGLISKQQVIDAVRAYEPFIVKLRDNYRSSMTALSEATSKKQQALTPKLAQAKDVHQQALSNALKETLEHGHNDIIQNLGNSPKTVVALWTILTDFVKADDFTSEVPLYALELLARFTGLKEDLLKKLKFESIQKRVSKKGSEKMKELLAVISKNASEEGKREIDNSSEPGPLQKAIAQPPKEGATPNTAPRTTGMKRPHEGEGSNGNPAKKIASGATTTSTPRQSTGTTAAKTAPRPNVFASLTRSVKPSPALNGGSKAAAKTVPAKPVAKPAPPMTSKFGDLLASITAPKEVPKAPVVPEGPPETPEEKKRRERKESRRHLRVKWKEGDELLQIKVFMQVEGEDEGRKDELVRDAHDDRSEGMMHKQRSQEEVDIDEDDTGGEIEYRPYPELNAVDLSDIRYADEQRRAEAYVTRGGQKTFSTSQQEIQNRHESTELMVVYTDPSDIPQSAKEPPILNDEVGEEKLLGQPTAQWLHQRMQEVHLYGVKGALETALSRINNKRRDPIFGNHNTSQQQYHQFTQPHGHSEQSHNNPTMSSNLTPEQAAESQRLVASLTALLAPIMGKPFPATEPPYHMNERQKAEWWVGYNRDHPATASTHYNQPTPAQHSQLPQAAMHQQPQMTSYQQPAMPTAQPTFDLQAIMRQVNLATSQNQQPAMPTPAPAFDLQSFVQQHTANAANQAPQQQQQPQQNWSAPHMNGYTHNFHGVLNNWNEAAGGGGGENSYHANAQGNNQNWAQQQWGVNGGNDNAMQWERDEKTPAHNHQQWNNKATGGGKEQARKGKAYKQGTKPCRFFLEDKCAKGDKCTYSHDIR